jgi:hypothetical protein
MRSFDAIRMVGVVAAMLAVSAGIVLGDEDTKPNLTGMIQTTDGKPVPADVFIAAAQPKSGSSPYCRPCYSDCQKRTKADADGKFEITSLARQLRFQILITASGYAPQFINDVDPSKGPGRSMSPREIACMDEWLI